MVADHFTKPFKKMHFANSWLWSSTLTLTFHTVICHGIYSMIPVHRSVLDIMKTRNVFNLVKILNLTQVSTRLKKTRSRMRREDPTLEVEIQRGI